MKVNIEIWASGGGTNADAIAQYFKNHNTIQVAHIVSNRKNAGVLEVAKINHVNASYWAKDDWKADKVLASLASRKVDLIVLAGFLKLVPAEIVQVYQGRILNIHPSLLPQYGGKNMYGDHVHNAVLAHREKYSGITIHEVNEEFDKGKILAQFSTEVPENIEDLKKRIHALEHRYFALTIEAFINAHFIQ